MLEDFDPIPRFVVASTPNAETAMMQWKPAADPKGWQYVPKRATCAHGDSVTESVTLGRF